VHEHRRVQFRLYHFIWTLFFYFFLPSVSLFFFPGTLSVIHRFFRVINFRVLISHLAIKQYSQIFPLQCKSDVQGMLVNSVRQARLKVNGSTWCPVVLGSTQPRTEMSTRIIFLGRGGGLR